MNRIPPHLAAHYLRLGLTHPATRAEISAAYRAAALKHHPDRGGCGNHFSDITDSYNHLMRRADNLDFRPASLRSFVDSRRDEPSPFNGIITAIVLPTLVGVIVGVRLIYFGGDREGLRAGGVSRFIPDEVATTATINVTQRTIADQVKQQEQQQQRQQEDKN